MPHPSPAGIDMMTFPILVRCPQLPRSLLKLDLPCEPAQCSQVEVSECNSAELSSPVTAPKSASSFLPCPIPATTFGAPDLLRYACSHSRAGSGLVLCFGLGHFDCMDLRQEYESTSSVNDDSPAGQGRDKVGRRCSQHD